MSCSAVATFPDASDASQVTVVFPKLNNSGASFVTEIISPLSITLASPRKTWFSSSDVASIIISEGTCNVGVVVSITLTIC